MIKDSDVEHLDLINSEDKQEAFTSEGEVIAIINSHLLQIIQITEEDICLTFNLEEVHMEMVAWASSPQGACDFHTKEEEDYICQVRGPEDKFPHLIDCTEVDSIGLLFLHHLLRS